MPKSLQFRSLLRQVFCLVVLVTAGVNVASAQAEDYRYASSSCQVSTNFLLTCDYRYSARLDVKDVLLELNGQAVQVKADEHKQFPATEEQSIALLILADVSDPKRQHTVEVKYAKSIADLLNSIKSHHKVGLAEFDSELRVLAPIGADLASVQKSSQSLKATGQATEFYKNILGALDLLKKINSDRKALIILSDGKDEDRAYKFEDVVKIAEENKVTILSLGYLESQQDTPFLQNLKRLAEKSYGLYYDVTDRAGALPPVLANKPFAFAEKGGRLTFQLSQNYEQQKVTIILGRSNGEKIALSSNVSAPDDRVWWQKSFDFALENWMLVVLVTVLAVAVVVGLIFLIRRAVQRKKQSTYAILSELNGIETKHLMKKTAIRIGRGTDNDIRLINDSISSHHAEIHRRREGDFYIVDLASTNGVYVNDEKVHQGELKNNDVIELGEVRLRFTAVN